MDHDYTLDELLGMLRRVMVYVDCDINSGTEKWCGKYKTCIGCRTALIDAIERKAREEWQRGYDEGYASADDWCAEHEDELNMHGYVRGPFGADNKMIYVGDVVTVDGIDHPVTVTRMYLFDYDWRIKLRGIDYTVAPSKCRQYRPPTVEDVLWEFVGALDVVDRIALDETVTDFAKRLRLADKED